MQNVTQALSTWTPESSADEPSVPQSWVEAIFTRLHAQLGAKVADLYAGVPPETVKAEWAQALGGFQPSEISRGLKACQTRVFAPTLGEFLRLCRPALDPEVAFIEAGHCLRQRDAGEVGDWTHPAVFRTAVQMGLEVRRGDYKAVRRRWEHLLQCEMSKPWQDVESPAPRLANEAKTSPPTTEMMERLRKLREEFASTISEDEKQP